jgi:hypothetical protein
MARVITGHPLNTEGPTVLHLRQGTHVVGVRALQPHSATEMPVILYTLEPTNKTVMEERRFVCLRAGAAVEDSHQYIDTVVVLGGEDVYLVFEKRVAGSGNA